MSLLLWLTVSAVSVAYGKYQCSPTKAYIDEFGDPLLISVASAQALFPPTLYNLTDNIVAGTILSKEDDICDNSRDITTDIAGKILILYSGGNCTEKYKILRAESYGAGGVFIINSIEFDYVYGIPNDITVENPTILSRMITKQYGSEIVNRLNNSEPIHFVFGCYADDYPTVLCVIDGNGNHWITDGQYIRNGTINDHPYYYKEGYTSLYFKLYIRLYIDNDHWYWVISRDKISSVFIARCNDLDIITHPGLCKEWLTDNSYEDFWWYDTRMEIDTGFNVSESLCEYEQLYLCFNSDGYDIGGLLGSYHRPTTGAYIWTKEWELYDESPGYFSFTGWYKGIDFTTIYYGYILYDPVEYPFSEIVAYCEIGSGNLTDAQKEDIYDCYPWYVQKPGVQSAYGKFNANNYITDSSLNISHGLCPDFNQGLPIINDTLTEYIYMCDNTIAHSYIEGEWILNGTTSDGKGIWRHDIYTDSVYGGGTLYLWFYETYSILNTKWWVITDEHPESRAALVDAYCPANTDSPFQCLSCWYFWFDISGSGKYYADCQFHLETTYVCNETNNNSTMIQEQQICIESDEYLGINDISGDYIISTNKFEGNYYYIKMGDQILYLYYYTFGNEWIISTSLGAVTQTYTFKCSSNNVYSISNCDSWYYSFLDEYYNIQINVGSCAAKNQAIKANKTKTAILVSLLIIVIAMITICSLVYFKFNSKKQVQPSNNNVNADDPTLQTARFETIDVDNTKNLETHEKNETMPMNDMNDLQTDGQETHLAPKTVNTIDEH